jgi:hypothetical protein
MNKRILLLAAVYFFIENSYFGWNFAPASAAELICDGANMVLLALAVRR